MTAWDLDNLGQDVNPRGLTREQIEDLVSADAALQDCSFRVLDRKTRRPIPFPGGTSDDVSKMDGRVTACTVRMQSDRDTARSMDLSMWAPLDYGFDPRFHYLQPFCDYYQTAVAFDGSGGRATKDRLLHVPLGILDVQVPSESRQGRTGLWTMKAEDLTRKIMDKKFAHNWGVRRGTNVVQGQIVPILTNGPYGTTPAGCPCPGPGYPADKMHVQPSDDAVATDQVFSRQDQQMRVVNDAAHSIGYWPFSLDHDAWVEIQPQPYASDAVPVPEWAFKGDESSIIGLPFQRDFTNKNDLANWVMVVGNVPGKTPFSVIVKNESPASFISIPNYGDVIEAPIIENPQIASAETAYLVGYNDLQARAIGAEALTWTGRIVPFLGTHSWASVEVKAQGEGRIVRNDNEISVVFGPDLWIIRTTSRPWLCLSWEWNLTGKSGLITMGQSKAL